MLALPAMPLSLYSVRVCLYLYSYLKTVSLMGLCEVLCNK